MKKTSPTKRSLDRLRKGGFTVGVVEKWNVFAKVKNDLYGFIDVVAMRAGFGIVGVQTTTRENLSKRIDKIAAEPRAVEWLGSGGRIFVHGWSKMGARGKVKRWHCYEMEVNIETIFARKENNKNETES